MAIRDAAAIDKNFLISKTLGKEDLIYYNISLSNNGIITGLLSNNQKTSIVWWRTDNIIANFFVE